MKLHEIENGILLDCRSDFELNGLRDIGHVELKTNIRFENMDDLESSLNAIDIEYNSEDVTFTVYVYKLNAPQCNVVK